MKLIKQISLADMFTMANGLIGMFAIMYIIDKNFKPACILLFIAIFIDGSDGAIARYLKSEHKLGIYLDSVSDSISFCFAPAVLIYTIYYDTKRGTSFEDLRNALTVICCSFLFIFGTLRLARFTYFSQHKAKNYFGLPTPALTFFIVCLVIITTNNSFFPDSNKSYHTLPIIILLSLLMISEIKYPKIRGKLIIFGIIAIIFGIFGVLYKGEYYNLIGIIALFLILTYIISSPIISKRL